MNKKSERDAQSETQRTRSNQSRVDQDADNQGRQGGATKAGKRDGNLSVGGAGAAGTIADFLVTFTGGIVRQLIAQKERELDASEESIKWYQRESEQNQQQLAELQSLLQSIEDRESEIES